VTVHRFLSEAYKIVFDVEGKRGKFLFGVEEGRCILKSETMREYHVTVNLQKMDVISYFEDVILLE